MPREHDVLAARARTRIDLDIILGHRDGLAVEAPLEAHRQRPREDRHLEAGKGQDGPEPLEREKAGDAEGGDARQAEKQPRPTHTE